MIYLDSAATTLQKPPTVYRAVRSAMATMTSPGRGTYGPAARASRTLLACREAAAALFQVDQPEQVVLTFNATHGLNLAIHSLVRPGATVLLSSTTPSPVPWPPSRSCACGWFRRRCSAPTFFWRPWSTS